MSLYTNEVGKQAENILSFFAQATDAEVAEGLRWYAGVRALADGWAKDYGYTLRQTAGVVAVLSPNTPWEKNIEYAYNAISSARYVPFWRVVDTFKDFGVRTFNSSIEKVWAILTKSNLDKIRGRKVRSFWDNIADVNSQAITHDLWSRRVVFNDLSILSSHITPKWYNTAVAAYHDAFVTAQDWVPELEAPYQLQAITWTVARRLGRVEK